MCGVRSVSMESFPSLSDEVNGLLLQLYPAWCVLDFLVVPARNDIVADVCPALE